jgi:hypothetical protein
MERRLLGCCGQVFRMLLGCCSGCFGRFLGCRSISNVSLTFKCVSSQYAVTSALAFERFQTTSCMGSKWHNVHSRASLSRANMRRSEPVQWHCSPQNRPSLSTSSAEREVRVAEQSKSDTTLYSPSIRRTLQLIVTLGTIRTPRTC